MWGGLVLYFDTPAPFANGAHYRCIACNSLYQPRQGPPKAQHKRPPKVHSRGRHRPRVRHQPLLAVCSNQPPDHALTLKGIIADIIGGILTLVALSLAPVSVVQPVMGAGLALLAVFSHFYLNERLRRKEWIGCAVSLLGTIGVGLTSTAGQSSFSPVAGLVLICAFATGAVASDRLSRGGHATAEISTGMQAGLCFGLSATISRFGVLLSELLEAPVVAILGVVCSLCATSFGLMLQTRGMKDGRAVVILTYANAWAILVAVLFGVFALNEPLPEGTAAFAARFLSVALVIAGTMLLLEEKGTTPVEEELGETVEKRI